MVFVGARLVQIIGSIRVGLQIPTKIAQHFLHVNRPPTSAVIEQHDLSSGARCTHM